MNRSILLIFAHPDDESFGLAGTIARYSDRGVPVDLICATRGEKGTRVGVPEEVPTGVAREAELRTAAAVTGIRNIYFLGYTDGELDKFSTGNLANRILFIMEPVRPEVVITFGPDGITGHKDHIAIGRAATVAFNGLTRTAGWPRKLYYVTIPASVMGEDDEGLATRPDDEVTTWIDITGYEKKKIQAIAAHKSQQDSHDFLETMGDEPDSSFFKMEHLYLAYPHSKVKEIDLFQ